MFVCIQIDQTKSFTATFFGIYGSLRLTVRIWPRYKKWTYLPLFVRIGQRYLKAKNK